MGGVHLTLKMNQDTNHMDNNSHSVFTGFNFYKEFSCGHRDWACQKPA